MSLSLGDNFGNQGRSVAAASKREPRVRRVEAQDETLPWDRLQLIKGSCQKGGRHPLRGGQPQQRTCKRRGDECQMWPRD